MIALLHSPLAHAIFVGWLSAASGDLTVLVTTGKTQGWGALKEFNWNTASFRWLVGIGTGLLAGLGFNMGGLS